MKALIFKKSYAVVLSLLLVLAILFSNVAQIPSAIFAEATDDTDAIKSGAVIVEEDETKRGEYERHYLTEDGSYVGISYSDPVNYQTEDGSWVAVDNSLSANILTGNLSTNNEKFKVKFANKANHGKLVSVKTDGYDISWGITVSADGENNAELDKVKVSADTKNTNSLPKTVSDASSLGAAVSTAVYENVYDDAVDIRYTVTHLNVKEDVILKKPSDVNSYKATYNIKGEYNATLNVDGSVTVTDEQGETLFVIGAPWMYDAAGETSEDITVTILKSGKTLEVKYLLSEEWLNAPDRVYPVTVDPTVSTRLYTGNIKDVSVYMDGVYDYNDHLKQYNRIGYEEPMYLHIGGVPMLPVDSYYVSSAIMLYASSINVFSIDGEEHSLDDPMWVTAQEILNDWDDWAFNLTQCSSTTVYNNGRLMQFGDIVGSGTNDNITNVSGTTLKQVSIEYAGEVGYDIFFSSYKGVKIDVSNHIVMNVVSAENSDYASYRPAVIIRYNYEKPSGLENDALYVIKNVGSGKYLTVDGAGTVIGTNVYQSTRQTVGNDDGSQVVRLKYNSVTDYFTMTPFYYGNRKIGFECDITEAESSYYNIKLISSGSDVDRYRWIFSPTGVTGEYRIIAAEDTAYALTAGGTANGTSDAQANGSGNIFVSQYSYSNSYQKWVVEKCEYQKNISSNSTLPYTVHLNKLLYLHSTTEINYWISSDTSIATVNPQGVVTPRATGFVTVTAISSTTVYNCTIHIMFESGEFALMSRYNGEYLKIGDSGLALADICELWNFSYNNTGFYLIYSDDYQYLTDTVSEGGMVTAQNALTSPSYYQQWRIELTSTRSYKLISRADYNNSNDYAIAAVKSDNQLVIKNSIYTNDFDFADEWEIVCGPAQIVNHYIDRGFIARNAGHNTMGYELTDDEEVNFENAKKILEAQTKTATKFFNNELGIQLVHHYFLADDFSLYDSVHNNFEAVKGDGITYINGSSCGCYNNMCTDLDSILGHFMECVGYYTNITYALWSGNYVYDEDIGTNRSVSYSNIIMILDLNSSYYSYALKHELSHQFGAIDHYHEGDDNVPCNAEWCTRCQTDYNPYRDPNDRDENGLLLPACIMGSGGPDAVSPVLCDACKNDIYEYIPMPRNEN